MKRLLYCLFFLLPSVSNAQIITRFAGGASVPLGDGGPATAAHIHDAVKGIFDKEGNYYVADLDGFRIRKVDMAGIITTVAGIGVRADSGDNGPATLAKLNSPASVTLDSAGNLYLCETDGSRVRRVDRLTGIITTVTGNGTGTSTGDSGPASAATVNDPQDICFDKFGNLYVAEYNARVRKIDVTGTITTFAGIGVGGYSGDGGLADTSKIGGIEGICSDTAGNIYIADNSNSRVFKIGRAGIITTVAGTNAGYLYNGDEIPATTANIDPYKITVDDTGNLYIAEFQNYRVRKVDTHGIIHTVTGIGTSGQSGDGGPATAAQFNYPSGVALDACGNLYITESNGNGLVHKVTFNPTCTSLSSLSVNTPSLREISIYPNPTTEQITITAPQSIGHVSITNLIGQTVHSVYVASQTVEVNTRNLANGVYIVTLTDDEGKRTVRKIIKQ